MDDQKQVAADQQESVSQEATEQAVAVPVEASVTEEQPAEQQEIVDEGPEGDE